MVSHARAVKRFWLSLGPWGCAAALAVMVTVLTACPAKSTGPDPAGPRNSKGTGTTVVDAGVKPADPKHDGDEATTGIPVGGASCDAPRCIYHAGADAHFACLSGSDGMCFHLGARCTPTNPCVFEKSSGRYRKCERFVQGACASFGGNCEPEAGCAYNPAAVRYQLCEDFAAGVCRQFGAACDPL